MEKGLVLDHLIKELDSQIKAHCKELSLMEGERIANGADRPINIGLWKYHEISSEKFAFVRDFIDDYLRSE